MKEYKPLCEAIIVAAGTGSRMGGPVPKQFIEVCGRPLITYALEIFEQSETIDGIVLVTGDQWEEYCQRDIVEKYGFRKVDCIVAGGSTRCYSVWNGLRACRKDTAYVFIHDAARAMITDDVIVRGYETVRKYSSAIASIQSKDTIRITDREGNVRETPDRSLVRCIQTPQIFDYKMITEAYEQMTEQEMKGFTDDGSVWEQYCSLPLRLYDGSPENIKVTTPEDLLFAEKMLQKCI